MLPLTALKKGDKYRHTARLKLAGLPTNLRKFIYEKTKPSPDKLIKIGPKTTLITNKIAKSFLEKIPWNEKDLKPIARNMLEDLAPPPPDFMPRWHAKHIVFIFHFPLCPNEADRSLTGCFYLS